MKQHKEIEHPDLTEKIKEAYRRCPQCGRELKQMRCRIDGPELYCPSCRITFDPSRLDEPKS